MEAAQGVKTNRLTKAGEPVDQVYGLGKGGSEV